jgi:cyclophilin family peptidyl-prolyl cis-trans isomerase/HEAT repeat protein
MVKKFTSIVFVLVFAGSLSAQITNDIRDILKYGDLRNNDELLIYLKSPDVETVINTLNVLSNAGDSTNIHAIGEQLTGNKSSKVRRASAFALGQIGTEESARILLEALNTEQDTEVLDAIVEAIGKTAGEDVIAKIPPVKLSEETYQIAAAMTVARFALRNIKNDNSISILNALLDYGQDGELNKYIAYALWRIRDRDLLAPERITITNLINSSDPETRSFAVNAFNAIKEPTEIPYLAEIYNKEADWRVKVNILNILGSYSLDSINGYQDQLLNVFNEGSIDKSDHVKITALSSIGRVFSQFKHTDNGNKPVKVPGTDILMRVIGSGGWLHSAVKAAAIDAFAKVMKDGSKNVLWDEFVNSTSSNVDVAVIRGFGYFENGDILREVRDTISSYVMSYNALYPDTTGAMVPNLTLHRVYSSYIQTAIDLLPKMKSDDALNLARLSFLEFADSRKPEIVYYSLEGLKSDQMKEKQDWTFENKQVLKFEYAGFEYPEDVGVMTLFAEAFGDLGDTAMVDELRKNINRDSYDLAKASAEAINKITGENITVNPADYPKHTDYDWEYLSSAKNTRIILKTSEGDIELELYPDAAPFTVMNFLRLAEKDYYDNTLFHRVIGNFVIQGGDPTSTGFGGPGYSIRGEYNNIPYERGTLGMASAGKDTEGSQFFITHARTPHLDGKYTVFGKVISGMDVVDRILVGDILEDVIVIRQ